MKEIQLKDNLEFELDAASAVYHRYGDVMYEAIWGNSFSSSVPWFPGREESKCSLVSMEPSEEKGKFLFTFSDGSQSVSVFDEENFFKSFYTDEKVSM